MKLSPIGSAIYHGHHGELLQGVFENKSGVYEPGLITLPFEDAYVKATFSGNNENGLQINNPSKKLALQAVRQTFTYFGLRESINGYLMLEGDVPEGKGLGSSTIDLCATIVAVSQSLNRDIHELQLAKMCIDIEHASDSTMIKDNLVLFNPTTGSVISMLNETYPQMHIVGVDTDVEKKIITNNVQRPQYTTEEKHLFEICLGLIHFGVKHNSLLEIGEAATLSADINQRYLPKRNYEQIKQIAKSTGAVGIQIAHTGTLLGIIYNNDQNFDSEKVSWGKRQLTSILGNSPYDFYV